MKFYSYLRKKGRLETIDKNSIVVQIYSQTKTDSLLTETQKKIYVIALEKYLDFTLGLEEEYTEDNVSIEEYAQPTNTNEYFYRYISKKTLKEVEKGKFKLGNLYEYQKTNDKHRGDIKEGHIHLLLENPSRQYAPTFYGGYNFLITCGSYIPPDDTRADYLLNKFGPCVIRIRNINSFLSEYFGV